MNSFNQLPNSYGFYASPTKHPSTHKQHKFHYGIIYEVIANVCFVPQHPIYNKLFDIKENVKISFPNLMLYIFYLAI